MIRFLYNLLYPLGLFFFPTRVVPSQGSVRGVDLVEEFVPPMRMVGFSAAFMNRQPIIP